MTRIAESTGLPDRRQFNGNSNGGANAGKKYNVKTGKRKQDLYPNHFGSSVDDATRDAIQAEADKNFAPIANTVRKILIQWASQQGSVKNIGSVKNVGSEAA